MNNAPESPSIDDLAGMAWWNSMSESDRLYWLALAKSAAPVDAWERFKRVYPERVQSYIHKV